jgi:hypothetical protein
MLTIAFRRYAWLAPVALCVAFFWLGGCSKESPLMSPAETPASFAAATPTTTHFSFDIDEVEFISCTGEEVHWTGEVSGVEHSVNNRGVDPSVGTQHFIQNGQVELTGVGLTSGGTYKFHSVQRFGSQSEDPINPYPETTKFLRKDKIIGPSGGVIGFLTVGFMFVVNGNGELVVEKASLDFTLECK